MTNQDTTSIDEPELTLDQELRFNILVPFYGAMERKRQEDQGKLTKQDASPIYTEAIKKIEALIANQVREARIKELKLWQSYWKNGKDTRNTDSYVSDRIKELGE